jgi:LacI family transcriptional regulator
VIAGEPYASTGIDRTAGFVETYAAAGLPLPPERIVQTPFDASGGRLGAEKLLAQQEIPTAIFAVNDFAAIGAIGAVRDHGLQVGTDIAIVGFNDTPLAAELPVPLTTVRSPMHEMGYRGLNLLVRLMHGEQVESERLAPQFLVRASSTGVLGTP